MKMIPSTHTAALVALGAATVMTARAGFITQFSEPPALKQTARYGLIEKPAVMFRVGGELLAQREPDGILRQRSPSADSGINSSRSWLGENGLILAFFTAVFVGLFVFQKRSTDG